MKDILKGFLFGTLIMVVLLLIMYISDNSRGCEYCKEPVRVYNYETNTTSPPEDEHTWTMELYPVKERLECVSSLQFDNWGGDNRWYLCFEGTDIFKMPEHNLPPSTHTSYYWIDVEYCPWCGRELD
jgi:hypothetical protein